MKSPSFRDLEQLSAYLDGQIPQSERTRLESTIKSDPALASALEELRQTRALLHRTPQRRAPRNFTLTPRMAGIRPPVPRLVPVLSWASAVAMLLFIFTLGAGLVGQLSLGAASSAPMMAAVSGVPGGSPKPEAASVTMLSPTTVAPALINPAATPVVQTPAADNTLLATPTENTLSMAVPAATLPVETRASRRPLMPNPQPRPLNLLLIIWLSLAVLLGASAILLRWLNKRAFQRKNPRG